MKAIEIARHDIGRAIRSVNFWVNLFVLFSLIPIQQFLFDSSEVFPPSWRQSIIRYLDLAEEDFRLGVVDASGLIHVVPQEYKEVFRLFPDEPSAVDAFQKGELTVIVVLPAGYYQGGSMELIYGSLVPGAISSLSRVLISNSLPEGTPEGNVVEQLEKTKSILLDAQGNRLSLSSSFLYFLGALVFIGGIVWFFFIVAAVVSYASAASTWVFHERKVDSSDVLFSSVTLKEVFLGKFFTQVFSNSMAVAVVGASYLIFAIHSASWQLALSLISPFLQSAWPTLLGLTIGTVLCGMGISLIASLIVSAAEATFLLALLVFLIGVPLPLLPLLLWSPDSFITKGLTYIPIFSATALPMQLLSSSLATTATLSWETSVLSVSLSLLAGLLSCSLGLRMLRRRFLRGSE